MSEKSSILLQLDVDAMPSVFDRVVAIDAGVQHIFSYGNVTPDNVAALVHGCIFTRGAKDLYQTAIFVGGSDNAAAEKLYAAVQAEFVMDYGLHVSVMLDPNGANTTAAAAVLAASKHLDLSQTRSLVLGGTGPVGQRVARLLASHGGDVRIGSRKLERAEAVCLSIRSTYPDANVTAVSVASSSDGPKALDDRELVIAAGTPSAVLLPKKVRDTNQSLKLAIDLNGVPPVGIEGVEPTDAGEVRDGLLCYGALGIGGTKMKTHKAAIVELYASNKAKLDIDAIYKIAQGL